MRLWCQVHKIPQGPFISAPFKSRPTKSQNLWRPVHLLWMRWTRGDPIKSSKPTFQTPPPPPCPSSSCICYGCTPPPQAASAWVKSLSKKMLDGINQKYSLFQHGFAVNCDGCWSRASQDVCHFQLIGFLGRKCQLSRVWFLLRSQHRSLHYSSSSDDDDDSTLFDEARVEKNKGNKGNNLILVLNWKIVLLLSVTDQSRDSTFSKLMSQFLGKFLNDSNLKSIQILGWPSCFNLDFQCINVGGFPKCTYLIELHLFSIDCLLQQLRLQFQSVTSVGDGSRSWDVA